MAKKAASKKRTSKAKAAAGQPGYTVRDAGGGR